VESITVLVGWMTRAETYALYEPNEMLNASFKFSYDNMKLLALLADKYIIRSLHKDIEV
jgi:hypothetical protein